MLHVQISRRKKEKNHKEEKEEKQDEEEQQEHHHAEEKKWEEEDEREGGGEEEEREEAEKEEEEEKEDTFSCLKSSETSGVCWYGSVPLWHKAANLVSKPLWVSKSTKVRFFFSNKKYKKLPRMLQYALNPYENTVMVLLLLLHISLTRFSALGGSGTAGSPSILQASNSISDFFFYGASSQKPGSPSIAICI